MIKGPIQQLRVFIPLAADKTLVESYIYRLVDAPDELLARTAMYNRMINAPTSIVGHDDLEMYERAQEGLHADGMPRREDPALLRGQGRFVDDIAPQGCVFVEFLRSSVPAGTITALDVADARTCDGVLAVYTADDLDGLGRAAVNALIPDAPTRPFDVLAGRRVTHGCGVCAG